MIMTEQEKCMETLAFEKYGGITSAANSLRKYFGLPQYHESLPVLDQWLNEGRFRCVCAVLVDAMGTSVLEEHCRLESFFMDHIAASLTSTFPPTTSAATTSFRTGKSPKENGWLGWNQYFAEKNDNIILFRNMSQYKDAHYGNYSYEQLPVSFITDEINQKGLHADEVWPGWSFHNGCASYEDELELAEILCHNNNFIYVYWDQLDTFMHHNGPSCNETGTMVRDIEQKTKEFARRLPADTGLLVLADHSQIDVVQKDFTHDADLISTFRAEPALEPRTVAFYIKDEKRESFERQFAEKLAPHFRLYTKEEVLRSSIFGTGIPAARYAEMIGDYLAVGEDNTQFIYKRGLGVKGDHAGHTKEEAMIPLILFNKS